MYQVVRTVQADIDLLEIWLHFAGEDADRADAALDMIERRYQILQDYPFAGRSRDELLPDLRSLTAGKYEVFYFVTDQQVQIVRILHGSRDIERIFEEEVP
jgi:toxin ParE1/3/4